MTGRDGRETEEGLTDRNDTPARLRTVVRYVQVDEPTICRGESL